MPSSFDKFSETTLPSQPAVSIDVPIAPEIPATPVLPPVPAPSPNPTQSHSFHLPEFNLEKFNKLKQNKRAMLGIFGGFMLVLAVVLQIAISSSDAAKKAVPIVTKSGPEITGTDTVTTDWPLYQDPYNSYEMQIHPTWSILDYTTNIESTKAFSLSDGVRLEISMAKTQADNVVAYIAGLDASRATLWQGRPSRAVGKSTPLRIGNYDGFERTELISATGEEYIVSYFMVNEDVFTFALIPTGKNKSIANQELVRQLHLAMTTFQITNIADRLGEWKQFKSESVSGLSYPAYTISFPATWAVTTKKTEGTSTLTISRNGYKIIISQAAVGNAVCLFKDSPSFQGSSGDLRTKDYTEYPSDQGYILRRYFKGNEGDNSIFLFCGKNETDTYFVTPLNIGGLNYAVPAKYDVGVLKEMDSIVKTLQPQ
ncbi:MAG: hypothetical protein WCL07_00575 [bacterium]